MYFEYIHSEIIDDRIDAQFFTPEYIKSLKKINQFRIETLGNISRRIFDPPHTAPEFVDKSDFEMIMIENITLNGIEGNFRAISETCHKDIFKNSHLEGNELLVSRVGNSSGTFASVFPCYKGKNVSGNISIIKLKDEIIDKEYAFAYFNSNIGQNSIKRNIANTARKFLTISKIREFQVPIPSPEIQKYIGDKVRKAEELREEAKRLKKEAEEIINESLNIKQLDVLFEGSKVKFEWASAEILTDRIDANYYEQKYVETINHIKKYSKKYVTLISIIDSIYTGKKPIYYEKGIEAYFVQSGNISSNFLELDNKAKVDLSKYNQVLFGDLLIAKDGETIGKIAINLTNETIIINEHTYCVRLKEEYKYYSAYIYYFLTNKFINPLIRREATGSAQKGLNFTFAENIIIPLLEEDKIMNLYNLELRRCNNIYKSKQLIQEAKQDVEDLIEGNFDMSKVKANS
jgi:type I restriction enzyme S subunit